jgi:hypothetical protein
MFACLLLHPPTISAIESQQEWDSAFNSAYPTQDPLLNEKTGYLGNTFAWEGFYWLGAYVTMAESTGDTKYLDNAVRLIDHIFYYRDDLRYARGEIDVLADPYLTAPLYYLNHRNEAAPGWRRSWDYSTRIEVITDGMILWGIMRFVDLVHNEPSFSSYQMKADDYIEKVKETVAIHDTQFVYDRFGDIPGAYYWPLTSGAGLQTNPVPYNQQAAISHAHLLLDNVEGGNTEYKNKAMAVIDYWKVKRSLVNGAYLWNYHLQKTTREDLSHGHIDVGFFITANRFGLLTETEMQRLANTFTDNLHLGGYNFAARVDGSGSDSRRYWIGADYIDLTKYDSQVFDVVKGTYDAYYSSPGGHAHKFLGWAEILKHSSISPPINGFIVDKNHPQCSNSGPGTESHPWCTIQKAADTLQAGETVYVKEGTYFETVDIGNSGTSGTPITYSNYPGHNPVVDGSGNSDSMVVRWNEYGGKKHYIIWDGIDVAGGSKWGIWVHGDHNIIRNCRIYGHGKTGIQGVDADYLTVHNCEVFQNGARGLIGNGISVEGGSNAEISYNYIHDNPTHAGIDSKEYPVGDPQITCANNYIHHNIIVDDDTGMYFRYQTNLRIHNNLIVRSNKDGIYLHTAGGGSGTEIFHNTILESGLTGYGSGIRNDQTTSVVIMNNIIQGNDDYSYNIAEVNGCSADYNLFYSPVNPRWSGSVYTNLATFCNSKGQECNSISADPLFKDTQNDDYHLLPGSPACGNGEGGSDIGAFPCNGSDSFCGDDTCDQDESCSTCDQDCSCQAPSESLANASTMTANSGNFRSDHPVEHLWDGCLEGTPECTSGSGTTSSFWVEFDLGETHKLTHARLFGDTAGDWLSHTWSLEYRVRDSDGWNAGFLNVDALLDDWSEQSLDLKAKKIRITVNGGSGTQARELEILGFPCHLADEDCICSVDMVELFLFVDLWKTPSEGVAMPELMEAIGLWKGGDGCRSYPTISFINRSSQLLS